MSATSLPHPHFIDRDPQAITAELIAQYERMSGRTLYPAQVERLLIDLIAHREALTRMAVQQAAEQNLLAFARAPMLDYLGELVGVQRSSATAATCTLRFARSQAGQTAVPIAAGTRVASTDGAVIFATDAAALIEAGSTFADVAATCAAQGAAGNGYAAGHIARLVDAWPSMDSEGADNDEGQTFTVSNLTPTAGGADEEDDERLRERIRRAPEAFSVAGSRASYVFHAMAAHPSICDVAVDSPSPGVVRIFPLTLDGLPSADILAAVQAACSAETVRPLCDWVQVTTPVAVRWPLHARLTLYRAADMQQTMAQARAALDAYLAAQRRQLGRDIVPAQLVAALRVAGVYDVQLLEPSHTRVLAAHEWGDVRSVQLDFAGVADG